MHEGKCLACLALQDEVAFLREMLKEVVLPKIHAPQEFYSPTTIDEYGKIVKVDEKEKIDEETLTDIDIVDHIVGH
jgi:hypothetical protein